MDTDPPELGSKEVNAFLTHLAVELHVSASTQNQALAAFLFLYRELLERDLDLEGLVRARTRPRLPLVMTVEELRAVLERLEGVKALVAGVLYEGGLRLKEALRRRLHDLDVQRSQITVRHGKGGKDRRTMLPSRVGEQLQSHLDDPSGRPSWTTQLDDVRRLHRQVLAECGARLWDHHACREPHVSPLICHPPA